MPRKTLQRLLHPILRPLMQRYTAGDRYTRFAGLRLVVRKGVFHPRLFYSTRTLWKYLDTLPLKGERLLEIGSGSGALALAAAQRGAAVTATDINPAAVACIRENAEQNKLSLHLHTSDLFTNVPDKDFRYIIVNPPFYPREPRTPEEYAWFCGEGHTWFRRFFADASAYLVPGGAVLMVLSDDCNIPLITGMARAAGWECLPVYSRRLLLEQNHVYQLIPAG